MSKNILEAVAAALQPAKTGDLATARKIHKQAESQYLDARDAYNKAIRRTEGESDERAINFVAEAKAALDQAHKELKAAAAVVAELNKPPTEAEQIVLSPGAKYGPTEEVGIFLRSKVKLDQADHSKAVQHYRTAKKLFAELGRESSKSASQRKHEHTLALAGEMAKGAANVDASPDHVGGAAWQLGVKHAMLMETQGFFSIVKPKLLEPSLAEVEKLFAEELEREQSRNKKFGIPQTEPLSQVLRSIAAWRLMLKSRLQTEIAYYTDFNALSLNLIDLN